MTKNGKPMKGVFMGRKRGSVVGQQLAILANGGTQQQRHPYTTMILDEFRKRQWTLVHGEYAVGSIGHRLGTGVDLIVFDHKENVHRALEIKCGMHAYFETSEGFLKAPLQSIKHSRYSEACVQLAVTHELLKLTSWTLARGTPFVVHASDRGVKLYELPPWARTAALTVLTSKR